MQLIVAALEGLALSKFQIIGEEQLQRDPPQSENDLRLFLARLFSEEETDLQRDQRFARRLKYRGGDMARYIDDFVREVAANPAPVPEPHRIRYFLAGLVDQSFITTMTTVCRYGDYGRRLCSQV